MSLLQVPKHICSNCSAPITTSSYVVCHHCNNKYHFNPCTVLSESTYNGMGSVKKAEWKCHQCKPRNKSPNNSYKTFIYTDSPQQNQQKQLRVDDDSEDERAKRFKNATAPSGSSNNVVATANIQQSDIAEIKSGMFELKSAMQQIATNVLSLSASHNEIREQLTSALGKINETLANLTEQVKELQEKDKEKSQLINALDIRIMRLEQQTINKNVEVNNVTDTNVDPSTVIKTIAATVGVDMNDADISRSYRIKKNNKIIVEFSTVQKKKEIMSKIKRHRIEANVLGGLTDNITNKYIYINDELTANNRRLLWMAKTKAKESNWKFVWVRNGNIYARKNENSSPIVVINATDIEAITATI